MKYLVFFVTACLGYFGFKYFSFADKKETLAVKVLQEKTDSLKMKGLTFVAPPRPFKGEPMHDITAVGGNYIAAVPYGFTRIGEPHVHFGGGQWWGESPEGTKETIKRAHKANIAVMLKPQVYIPRGWVGSLDFPNDSAWASWEADYRRYIFAFVDIAVEMNVEMLCIGTELKLSTQKRSNFWRNMIRDIRKVYKGKLTYSANWDEYQSVPFWDMLDYVGVNAYFVLSDAPTPTVEELKKAWQPYVKELRDFQKKTDRPIVFTEFGYMSVDGCAGKGWEVQANVKNLNINELAQANALDALYGTFWNESWWAGSFLWKWFPEGQGHEGYIERDYTPQQKKGEQILKKWFL